MRSSYQKVLNKETIHTGIQAAQYAVRGPIVDMGNKFMEQIKNNKGHT